MRRRPRLAAARVHFFQPPAQLEVEPGLRTAVAGRLDHLVVPLDQPVSVGERAFLLARQRGRHQKYLGFDVLRPQLARSHFGRCIPERGSLGLERVAHHQPLQIGQTHAQQVRVLPAHRRVLARHQHPADHAVLHRQGHRQLREIACNLRQPLIAPFVIRPSPVAIPGAQQADEILREIPPPARSGVARPSGILRGACSSSALGCGR